MIPNPQIEKFIFLDFPPQSLKIKKSSDKYQLLALKKEKKEKN